MIFTVIQLSAAITLLELIPACGFATLVEEKSPIPRNSTFINRRSYVDRGINAAVTLNGPSALDSRRLERFSNGRYGACEFGETEVKPTWTVTTANDIVDDNDGLISLREAISKAKDGETVVFDLPFRRDDNSFTKIRGLRISIAIDATSIGGITPPRRRIHLQRLRQSCGTYYADDYRRTEYYYGGGLPTACVVDHKFYHFRNSSDTRRRDLQSTGRC